MDSTARAARASGIRCRGALPPPDLIIQDELHLISGPLGTMVGLYETALDELCAVGTSGRRVRPKIIASTATVRRAENQIRALFNRRMVDIFPPPGPDRRDSFFAETHSPDKSNARLYLGVAAQGRSPKVVMLRVYLALLAAAQKWYTTLGGKTRSNEPGRSVHDAARLLQQPARAGRRRALIEDEVRNRLSGYATRANESARRTDSSPVAQDRLRGGRADEPRQHGARWPRPNAALACVSARRSASTWPSPRT